MGLLIVVVVVVVVSGGDGRGAAVDEGGVDHRQVVAGRKQGDVRVGANGVQGGGHAVKGERQARSWSGRRSRQDGR